MTLTIDPDSDYVGLKLTRNVDGRIVLGKQVMAKAGDLVRFKIGGGLDGQRQFLEEKGFRPGALFKVTAVRIGLSSSKYWLEGLGQRHGDYVNTSMFELVIPDNFTKWTSPPSFWCPICNAREGAREREISRGLSLRAVCSGKPSHVYETSAARTAQNIVMRPAIKYPTPDKPGFYWAKWINAMEGSRTKRPTEELTPKPRQYSWEVVEVWYDGNKENGGLGVAVAGEAIGQDLQDFFWGPPATGQPDA